MTVHNAEFPIPFPLTEAELQAAGLTAGDPQAAIVARERAYERGRHLVEARYPCTECHGRNFAGGVMVNDPLIGQLLGSNITSGRGSKAVGLTAPEWDRIVRHGLRRDGSISGMPSQDFQAMSDEELSDIAVFVQGQPPVDNEVPPILLGPLGKVLVATGQLHIAADMVKHDVIHPSRPPEATTTVAFGGHLAAVCVGCHRDNFAGGPIVGGDPNWVPARNLTPHQTGLAGWTFEQFKVAMREGRRPDGTPIQVPMTLMVPYARQMTDVEIQALWMYLQSLPPTPTNAQ